MTRYSRGQPVRLFERIAGKRAEALDAIVYSTAAKAALGAIAWDAREVALSEATPQAPAPPRRPAVIRSAWLERPDRRPRVPGDTAFRPFAGVLQGVRVSAADTARLRCSGLRALGY